jgi:FkbM family methyltransferase
MAVNLLYLALNLKLLVYKMYYSQSNQDKWVVEFLKFKKNGYFIELGAYDGIQTSNTYYMEKNLGWDGLCVEANPSIYQLLIKNRTVKNVNVALTDYVGECYFLNDKITSTGTKVPCNTLNNILKENNCPKNIDYMSIDIEGYEYIVLKDFNFSEWNIGLMTIEHNLYCDGNDRKDKVYNLMIKNGFTRVVEDAPCLDKNPLYNNKPYEDWYINNNLL